MTQVLSQSWEKIKRELWEQFRNLTGRRSGSGRAADLVEHQHEQAERQPGQDEREPLGVAGWVHEPAAEGDGGGSQPDDDEADDLYLDQRQIAPNHIHEVSSSFGHQYSVN